MVHETLKVDTGRSDGLLNEEKKMRVVKKIAAHHHQNETKRNDENAWTVKASQLTEKLYQL